MSVGMEEIILQFDFFFWWLKQQLIGSQEHQSTIYDESKRVRVYNMT